jgi:hypothetical protein
MVFVAGYGKLDFIGVNNYDTSSSRGQVAIYLSAHPFDIIQAHALTDLKGIDHEGLSYLNYKGLKVG